MRLLRALPSLLVALRTLAFPTEPILKRQQVQTLSPGAVAAFRPYTFYAASAYCTPSTLQAWACGANCDANSGFQPIASGGDGAVEQYWYVGYDPSLKTIIVGHQGTDPVKLIPLLTDVNAVPIPLYSPLFPDIGLDVAVHAGFKIAQSLSAKDVLAAVNTGFETFETTTITTVGHSLGAAISLLDALYLKIQFPDSTVRFYGYGLPRVGNQAFANLVDSRLDLLSRITNREDPVPTVPIMALGYKHPSGEDHIEDDGSWKACPGQDNPDEQCIDGAVPILLAADLGDHDDPYGDVTVAC